MARFAADTVLDGGLSAIKTGALAMWALNSSAYTIADASANKLAAHTTASADYTIAADGSGRKVTTATASGVTVDTSGTFNHVALTTGADGALLFVTTGTSQPLGAGNTVDFPAWVISIAQPTAP